MLTVNADAHPLMRRMHRPNPKRLPKMQDKRSVVPMAREDVDAWLGAPAIAQSRGRRLSVRQARQGAHSTTTGCGSGCRVESPGPRAWTMTSPAERLHRRCPARAPTRSSRYLARRARGNSRVGGIARQCPGR